MPTDSPPPPSPTRAAGLPDPLDRSQAWDDGEPAYLRWWQHVTALPENEQWPLIRALPPYYAYAVPDRPALDALAEEGPLVEIGAGLGYWARLLRDLGADVAAYDHEPPGTNSWTADAPPWTPVALGDDERLAAHPDRTWFVCWPERPGFLPHALRRLRPACVALVTDGPDPSGSDSLYAALNACYRPARTLDVPRFPGRYDRLTVWQRDR